jgi:hypothetical protein
VKWSKLKCSEVVCIEVKWSKVKWSEVKWSEVKWSEVKWSEVKWSEVKWSEVKRSEVKRSEVKWRGKKGREGKEREVKRSDDLGWNLCTTYYHWFIVMYLYLGSLQYVVSLLFASLRYILTTRLKFFNILFMFDFLFCMFVLYLVSSVLYCFVYCFSSDI